jgi:hypothetical protein
MANIEELPTQGTRLQKGVLCAENESTGCWRTLRGIVFGNFCDPI